MSRKCLSKLILSAAVAALPGLLRAETFSFIQPAALDQPRINALIKLSSDGDPLTFEDTFNIQAFYDTGASGILLSEQTAGLLGIQPALYNGAEITFSDVGVAGTDNFWVSDPLHIRLAPYHPDADVDNFATYPTVYNQSFGPVRTQIGPQALGGEINPLLEGLDVFGIPVIRGKVVVMDPKPVNTFLDTMRTYVYNPGTAYNPAAADTDPGIPNVSRHVKLSFASFDRFTTTTPAGAPGPSLGTNPFIGWDPNIGPSPAQPPGIKISYNGLSTEGTWLLDTGAAASIISKSQAAALGITYDPATVGTDSPVLLGVPAEEQFTLTIGGIGGTSKIAGFYLDTMLIRSQEGDRAIDSDPAHLTFQFAPVLVSDITLKDPSNGQILTLDGIFGMNYLVASAFVTEGGEGGFPIIDSLTFGQFDWIVYDDVNGVLGLQPAPITAGTELQWAGDFFENESYWDTTTDHWIGGLTRTTYTPGDAVLFDDGLLGLGLVQENIVIFEPMSPGGVRFNNSILITYRLEGEPITGFTGVTKENTGTVYFYDSNTYTGSTDIRGGTMIFEARQDIGPVNVRAGATLRMRASQSFKEINIDSGYAELQYYGNRVLVVEDATVIGTGKLDLWNNSMIVNAPFGFEQQRLTKIEAQVASARNAPGGLWTGPGITSELLAGYPEILTLAVMLNDNGAGVPLMGTFAGEPVDERSVLVRYTYVGDLNLDGVVDSDDYFRIDRGYLQHRAHYADGDINYDGRIDIDDYFLIDRAFVLQASFTLGSIPAPASVPEPASLALVALGAAMLLRRRR